MKKRYWLLAVLGVVAFVATVVTASRFGRFRVLSHSMEPTVMSGDCVIVDMWYYRSHEPQRGEVVMFRFPEDIRRDFINRCVAIPGDTIEIRGKQVLLNGNPLTSDDAASRDGAKIDQESGTTPGWNSIPRLEVPEGSCFCLGDNRERSLDSRYWGLLSYELLRGKPLAVYWSKDLSRVGTRLNPRASE
jgi:signal peptidase I